jgi:hypothetical protein
VPLLPAGHLLGLVRMADEQAALTIHAYEQRAQQ